MSDLPVITIASCANEKFATGLSLAMISCLAQSSGKYHYDLVVMDGGLEKCSLEKLASLLKAAAEKNQVSYNLRIIKPEPSLIEKLPERAGTWMTYARFLLTEMLTEDAVIYLDSDILCLKGIEQFYQAWDGQAAMVAVQDPMRYLREDWPVADKKPDTSLHYFNAGLILMNLNWMRSNLSLPQVKQWIDKLGMENLPFHDQTILNYVARGQIIEIERANNLVLQTEFCSEVPLTWRNANMHYIGRIKPWLREDCEAKRFFAEVLYYHASIIYGVGGITPRYINKKNLLKTQRKALFYPWIRPSRGITYKAIKASIHEIETIEGQLSEKDFYYQAKNT